MLWRLKAYTGEKPKERQGRSPSAVWEEKAQFPEVSLGGPLEG